MEKILALLLTFAMAVGLSACERAGVSEETSAALEKIAANIETTAEFVSESKKETTQTAITLTAGDIVLNGYLNDSAPAQSLVSQLPVTVVLNDSDNDFCGGNLDIEYSESDVQNGYKNGDLAFWTPANNFVIFVDGEENSANTGDLVILGKITETQEKLDALEGTLSVTVSLADGNEGNSKTENESSETEVSEMKIKITVGETELTAVMEDNATTRAIIEQMPMTLPMMDLYGREMCYRYGAYALPTDNLRSDGYEVGDIAYWAPGGSLVILYKQNGEQFERQHLGHIDSGVEVFENTGDAEVRFEVVDN
ncbi:MAG: cyclophilin-like fold protein [Ruminococcus sp.]|nr:cyclophilin-like fold protein [Ruminococcus sp.]